jgi:hypothetical protein
VEEEGYGWGDKGLVWLGLDGFIGVAMVMIDMCVCGL